MNRTTNAIGCQLLVVGCRYSGLSPYACIPTTGNRQLTTSGRPQTACSAANSGVPA